MPYMQRLVLGFPPGALILGLPWPGAATLPRCVLLVAAGGLLVMLVAVMATGAWRRPSGCWVVLTGALLGLGWSALAHDRALAARLSSDSEGARALTVQIIGDPQPGAALPGQPQVTRFQAEAVDHAARGVRVAPGDRFRLTWYDAPDLEGGEVWLLQVVLKRPWSYANPGGFDYERWLLGAGLQGTGWVRGGERVAAPGRSWLEHLRTSIAQRLQALPLRNDGVLLALLLGRAGAMPDRLWDVLRNTGTVHLMVISGLHVSLAAALGFAAGRWLCRLCPPLLLWVDARAAGCVLGGLSAVAYVALAGAGLPALRALCMGLGALALLAGGRTGRAGQPLLLALALLLALQPLSVHQQGLWLSFGAVAILLLVFARDHGRAGPVAVLLRAQLALSLGMLPLVALLTHSLPVSGVPANLLAVPLMSLVVVPAALLGALLMTLWPWAGGLLLYAADLALSVVLSWLQWLDQAPAVTAAGGAAGLVIAQCAALFWLCGVPRWVVPVLLLCCVLPLVPRAGSVVPGGYRVMALDVGQGTAVVIDTHEHRLLFDAGPAFPGGFETGSAVVVPSVRASGRGALDVLVLSHDDLDHVGGAPAVRSALRPGRVLTATGEGADAECHGESWRWDGVSFRLLQVSRPDPASKNDDSCILLVDDGRVATLIAGDIGVRVEAALLRQMAALATPVGLLFAPHHGSISSSSRAFVRVVRPRLVFVSAGMGNRFGHPHPRVVERYREVGASIYQTGRDGALIWRSDAPQHVVRWRVDRAPYWRGTEPAGTASSR